MFLRTIRFVFRIVLKIIARVDISGYDYIPETGGAIVVINHIGRLDGMLGVILADRDDFILMVAEKYQKYAFWRWAGKKVDAVWLDRYEADFHAMRVVYKRLKSGEILGARLVSLHNVHHYLKLVRTLRESLIAGQFEDVRTEILCRHGEESAR